MKTFLRLSTGLALLCFSFTIKAQYTENFTSAAVNSTPPDWKADPNTDVAVYQRPGLCGVNDQGMLTPGVGQTDDYMTVLIVTPTGSTTEGMVSPHSYNYFNAHDGFAPYYEGATIMLHFEAGNKQGNLRVRTKGTPYQQ